MMAERIPIVLAMSVILALGAGSAWAWPDAPPAFPLQVDESGRGLVDQQGVPFLVVGDTAWSLTVRLDDAELETYLTNRRARGFNTLLIQLTEVGPFGGPTNTNGDAPWAPLDDFTQPVEAYWDRVEYILERTHHHGFLVLATAMYVGYQCGAEGWASTMQQNSVQSHTAFGRMLATRYGHLPNLVWVQSGDVDPAICGLQSKTNAIASELKTRDVGALHTGHCTRFKSSLDCFGDEPWLDVDSVYSDCIETPRQVRDAHEDARQVPNYFVEGQYEGEGVEASCVMNQLYWPTLGGLQGSVYGNRPVWLFDPGWQSALSDAGADFAERAARLFKSRPWADLEPDYDHTVVTGGYGSINDGTYAAAASTADKLTLIAFAPVATTLTVDMSQLSGPFLQAWKYDTHDGTSVDAGTYPSLGTQQFVMSGSEVLVIDGTSTGFGFPGTEIYYVPEPSTLLSSWLGLGFVALLNRRRARRSTSH